jgi:sec-independent protein translocase protein TatC
VLPLVVYAWICFILGGLFCFFVIYPFILVYMAEVFTPKVAEIQWSLSNYVSFTTNLLLAFGVVFEQPVLFALLAKIGIVTASGLSKFRSYAVVIIFTVAALITPPDPFSQTTCAIPMWGLYEISILVVRMIEKGEKKKVENITRDKLREIVGDKIVLVTGGTGTIGSEVVRQLIP